MLTVDFDRLDVRDGMLLLDLGCGGGRHAFEAWRRGATVVALDRDPAELRDVLVLGAAVTDTGASVPGAPGGVVGGDALALPFPDGTFDCVIASEILEHVGADDRAIAELARVLRPGGRMAVTVPNRWPEHLCWALDRRYHDRPGGHVRIYRRRDLEDKLAREGLCARGSHHAHALHTPYWWLRCVAGVDRAEPRVVRRYHDLLVWQLVRRPRWLERAERVLNPILGKSLVVYAERAAR